MISARVVGAVGASQSLNLMATKAIVQTNKAVKHHATQYRNAVRKRASGRPGPNIITKKYWNSIQTRNVSVSTTSAAVAIGTDAAQGFRLENGFVGADSLGRIYNQPPYPHWEQDLVATANALQMSMAAIVGSENSTVDVGASRLRQVSFE